MFWTERGPWLYLNAGMTGGITGKYLFFSPDKQALIALAQCECADHGFKMAKVSTSANGGDFVLCLYWCDDSRKHELAERHKGTPNVKYRYWKSDAATLRGEYSKQHLQNKQ